MYTGGDGLRAIKTFVVQQQCISYMSVLIKSACMFAINANVKDWCESW